VHKNFLITLYVRASVISSSKLGQLHILYTIIARNAFRKFKVNDKNQYMKEVLGFDKLWPVPYRYLSRQIRMASINDHSKLNPTESDLPCWIMHTQTCFMAVAWLLSVSSANEQERQCMYRRDIEANSRDNFCSRKVTSSWRRARKSDNFLNWTTAQVVDRW
jgi:hypothetical protein